MEYGPLLATGATAEVYAVDTDRVLKLFTDADRTTVEREARATRVAAEAGLPAPGVHDVVTVDGRYGLVLSRHDGPTLLNRLKRRPWRVVGVARTLATLQGRIHAANRAVDGDALPSLERRLRRDVDEASGLTAAEREAVHRRLDDLCRRPGRVLCHYDLHPENVLATPDGPVVVDWRDGCIGHPAADVARSLVLARFAPSPTSPLRAAGVATLARLYRRAYRRQVNAAGGVALELAAEWTVPVAAARLAEGVPGERRLLAFVRERLGAGG